MDEDVSSPPGAQGQPDGVSSRSPSGPGDVCRVRLRVRSLDQAIQFPLDPLLRQSQSPAEAQLFRDGGDQCPFQLPIQYSIHLACAVDKFLHGLPRGDFPS
eukprot:521734-Hanusia_phi.AAC.1